MANITRLPNEIIGFILGYEDVSCTDIVNFCLTCKSFCKMVNNNNMLWRRKFFQRWPALKKICSEYWHNTDVNVKEELIERAKCGQELSRYFSDLHDSNYYKENLSAIDMESFNFMFLVEKGAHPLKYYYLEDELIDILKSDLWDTHTNLTHTYYARKTLVYMKQYHLRNKWRTFIKLPAERLILEWVVTFVAQWCQPQKSLSYSCTTTLLDNIAEQALKLLKELYPTHSIFSISAEQFTFWKDNNIEDNQWNSTEAMQVINVLSNVMFHRLGFHANNGPKNSDYDDKKRCFIDCVLETKYGTIVSIAIIFQSVARRLGVRCDLVSFPNHFFLAWKKSYNATNSGNEGYHYIDILSNGSILSRKDCPKLRDAVRCPVGGIKAHKRVTPVEVLLRLANSLLVMCKYDNDTFIETRWILELQHMVDPCNREMAVQLGYYYIQREMNLYDVQAMLSRNGFTPSEINIVFPKWSITEEVQHSSIQGPVAVKMRNEKVRYAIGMLVESNNGLHFEKSHGVIIGWDIEQIRYEEMEYRSLQNNEENRMVPYYKILACNNVRWYTSQALLEPMKEPRWINHSEIGRYFCCFEGTHYVPNRTLELEYPQDSEIRTRLLEKYKYKV